MNQLVELTDPSGADASLPGAHRLRYLGRKDAKVPSLGIDVSNGLTAEAKLAWFRFFKVTRC